MYRLIADALRLGSAREGLESKSDETIKPRIKQQGPRHPTLVFTAVIRRRMKKNESPSILSCGA